MVWELVSGRMGDGSELLVLKKNGKTWFEYGPSESGDRWFVYSYGFPCKAYVSREACIKHACDVAQQHLIVREFPSYGGEK